jgi:hypothetical protein
MNIRTQVIINILKKYPHNTVPLGQASYISEEEKKSQLQIKCNFILAALCVFLNLFIYLFL